VNAFFQFRPHFKVLSIGFLFLYTFLNQNSSFVKHFIKKIFETLTYREKKYVIQKQLLWQQALRPVIIGMSQNNLIAAKLCQNGKMRLALPAQETGQNCLNVFVNKQLLCRGRIG